jgi:hypothetical protein
MQEASAKQETASPSVSSRLVAAATIDPIERWTSEMGMGALSNSVTRRRLVGFTDGSAVVKQCHRHAP